MIARGYEQRTPPAPASGWLVSLVLSLPFPRLAFASAFPLPLPLVLVLVPMYPVSSYLHTSTHPYVSYPILTRFCSKLSDPPWVLILDSLNWTAISFGFASGADLSLAWQWAVGVRVMDPGRLLGCTHSSLRHCQPQVPTVCLWSLMLFDVLGVLSVISVPRVCLELTPRTTRTKQALSHGHRSSFIVHRPSVRCSSAGRSRPVQVIYRLSSIWHPTLLRTLRSLRPRVSTYLPIAHPSAADR